MRDLYSHRGWFCLTGKCPYFMPLPCSQTSVAADQSGHKLMYMPLNPLAINLSQSCLPDYRRPLYIPYSGQRFQSVGGYIFKTASPQLSPYTSPCLLLPHYTIWPLLFTTLISGICSTPQAGNLLFIQHYMTLFLG